VLKKLNLLEETLRPSLELALNMRYDICTCNHCRRAMLTHATAQIGGPAAFVSPEELDAAVHQLKLSRGADLNHALFSAIEQVSGNPPHPPKEDFKATFKTLLEKIRKERNLDLRNYHLALLRRRLALRIRASKLNSYADYIKLLETNPKEFDKLFETLCINVSEFFRDTPVWVTVQYLFENMLRVRGKEAGSHLRIWSAGCASGEEPYTIAIVLKEVLSTLRSPLQPQIFATDIDKACLHSVKKAEYRPESVKNVNEKLIEKYFLNVGGTLRVIEEMRKMVEADYLDLTADEFLKDIDVIFCRNVFIYFNRTLQDQLLRHFHASLKPGGYIVLGTAESLSLDLKRLFEEVDANARIFRKI
jgi:chemotaxis methyl-accepting protein methylase